MTPQAEEQPVDVQICFVCTGNRCRSPYAAHYLESLLVDLPVGVSSVGTSGTTDQPVPDALLKLATKAGLDLSSHRSRLASAEVRAADLVLGFERAHVSSAVVEAGTDKDKTFTLAEFARLAADVTGDAGGLTWRERFQDTVARCAEARRESVLFVPGDDIDDPFSQPEGEYKRMTKRVTRLCEQVARALREVGAQRA